MARILKTILWLPKDWFELTFLQKLDLIYQKIDFSFFIFLPLLLVLIVFYFMIIDIGIILTLVCLGLLAIRTMILLIASIIYFQAFSRELREHDKQAEK